MYAKITSATEDIVLDGGGLDGTWYDIGVESGALVYLGTGDSVQPLPGRTMDFESGERPTPAPDPHDSSRQEEEGWRKRDGNKPRSL